MSRALIVIVLAALCSATRLRVSNSQVNARSRAEAHAAAGTEGWAYSGSYLYNKQQRAPAAGEEAPVHWDRKTYASFYHKETMSFTGAGEPFMPSWCQYAKSPADLMTVAAVKAGVAKGWTGETQHGAIEDDAGILAKGLLTPQEAAELLEIAKSKKFDVTGDSIDGRPTVETYPFRTFWSDQRVKAALEPALWSRVLPLARRHFNAPDLKPLDILIRRYDGNTSTDVAGETSHGEATATKGRDFLPLHQDAFSVVTINISLQPKGSFEGGVFVATMNGDGNVPTRMVQMDVGDVFMHNATTLHGVEVTRGTRYSLLVWTYSSVKPSGLAVMQAQGQAGIMQ